MKYYLLVLLGIVCSCSSLFAAINDPDPAYREKIIRNGVKALNKLIRQNEYNNKHQAAHKNKYLLVLAGNGEFIEQRNTRDAVPLLNDVAVKTINENLVNINDQRKLGVYIIVYNNWYLDLFKSIPDNARIPYLTDLQPWSKDNIKQKIVAEMGDLSDEIFTRADFTGYEKRVSIVCGRVISLLRKAEHKTSMVINVKGDESWTTGELKALNARITSDLPDLSDVANYLIAYPNALKTAWLDKGKKTDKPDLPYLYHPQSGSFLDMLGERSLNQPTGTYQDGAIDSKSLVYDYAKVFTAEEREKLIRDFLEISQNGGYAARIFFANHNTPAEQLGRIKEIMNNPAPRDVLLYMYIDPDKTVHAQLKLGKEVPQSQEVSIFMDALATVIDGLGLNKISLTGILDGLSAFIAKGKIPERFYNPESKDKAGNADYNPVLFEVYKQKEKIDQFQPELMIGSIQRAGINTGSYTNAQLEFAFICGFWNGLVDMVASIPHLASWIVKMIINEGTVRADFVQGVIKLIEQCEFTPNDLAFAFVMPNGAGTEIGKCLIEVAGKYLIKKFKQDNACQNAATVGGVVFVVIMAVLPFTDVAAVARVADFLAMIDPAAMMLRSLGAATRIIYKGGRMLYSSGKYYLSVSLQKGGRIVAEFLDESLQLINAANCPGYQFAFAGETRWARFPPETELGGQLNGVRYMTDGTGKPVLTENGEKVIVATRAGNEGKELIGIEEAKKPEVPEAEGTPHAPTVDEFSTINGRVNKPGGRMDKYKTYNEFEDVPSRYSSDPRFNKLAEDPAHGNEISEVTRQEAMAGLEAETQGLIKGPIERGPKEIEFYDGDGLPWDVKTPPSFGPKMPEKMKYKKVGEAIEKELVKKEDMVNPKTKKLEKRRVILDCTYMTETDHVGLWKWLNEHLDAEAMSRIIEVNVKL